MKPLTGNCPVNFLMEAYGEFGKIEDCIFKVPGKL